MVGGGLVTVPPVDVVVLESLTCAEGAHAVNANTAGINNQWSLNWLNTGVFFIICWTAGSGWILDNELTAQGRRILLWIAFSLAMQDAANVANCLHHWCKKV